MTLGRILKTDCMRSVWASQSHWMTGLTEVVLTATRSWGPKPGARTSGFGPQTRGQYRLRMSGARTRFLGDSFECRVAVGAFHFSECLQDAKPSPVWRPPRSDSGCSGSSVERHVSRCWPEGPHFWGHLRFHSFNQMGTLSPIFGSFDHPRISLLTGFASRRAHSPTWPVTLSTVDSPEGHLRLSRHWLVSCQLWQVEGCLLGLPRAAQGPPTVMPCRLTAAFALRASETLTVMVTSLPISAKP